jgi:hypothetical protein
MAGAKLKDIRASVRMAIAVVAMTTTVVAGVITMQQPAAAAEASTSAQAPAAAAANAVDAGIVKTADLSKFQPGNIVSDAVFFNKGTMTEAQIQSFLESKVSRCASGYTCLKDYYDTARTISADAMCGAYSGGARERASRIIYKVAQSCGINPQVILVMLQKEQGLVTTTAPSSWNYQAAMGQGCPDTAACDSRYYGLFNQVFWGAWQMKRYANPPGTSQFFTWYAPGKTWNILYHPNRACGTSPVYVQNQATANLYYYTPYQPNRAALAAGYAAANDACSSYGNRNFYNYFTDWFGSTQVPSNACTPPSASAVASASGLFVTIAETVNARRAPTTSCDEGLLSLGPETLVARTGTHLDWTRIDAGGASAWVRSDLLVPLAETPSPSLSLDDSRHVFALTKSGSVLAYPFSDVGRWGPAVTLLEGQELSQLVAVGDMDSDGHRDLVALDAQSRALLYRGDGAGLAAAEQVAVDWSATRFVTSAGDFDGDGNPDAFTVDRSGKLNLWRGDGDGSFLSAQVIGRGWSSMTAIAGGSDLSGDGVPDLLARSATGTLHLYRGNGAAGWLGGAQIGRGWASMNALVMPGDFTGDGKPDLLARTAAGALHLYRGTGAGLAHMAQIGVGWSGMASLAGPGITLRTGEHRAVTSGVGDLSGDGHPDVAAVAGEQLLLYRGNGSGGWSGSGAIGSGWPGEARLIAMADFNGDGLRDLGRLTSGGRLWLLPGTSAGAVGDPISIGTGWGSMDTVVGGVDFDGDGNADVVARNTAGTLFLYRGDGAGGWAEGGRVIAEGWGDYDKLIHMGDFDGDTFSDFIARDRATGALWLHSTDGAGGWTTRRQVGQRWGAFRTLTGPGDFDGDGKADILGTTSTGALYLYRGDGAGGWSGSGQIGRGWSSISQIM